MKKVKSILHSIKINNSEQYYTVQTTDKNKPLILFLHGGPGGANIGMSSVLEAKSKLTNHFTIIQYDQRGAGKSYYEDMTSDDLSLKLMLEDLKILIDKLLLKFNQKKICIIGHSFGTVLGIRLCKEIPHKINSYIGISQLTNLIESEKLCTSESLKLSDTKKNAKARSMIEESKKCFDAKKYSEYIMLQRLAMTKIGGFSYNRKPMNPNMLYIISALSPHYSISDAKKMHKGLMFSTEILWNEMMEIDFTTEIDKIDVPAYFLFGEKDIVAPHSVAKKFIDSLDAPEKKTIIFKKSGHSLQMEEKEKYEDIVIELLNKNI